MLGRGRGRGRPLDESDLERESVSYGGGRGRGRPSYDNEVDSSTSLVQIGSVVRESLAIVDGDDFNNGEPWINPVVIDQENLIVPNYSGGISSAETSYLDSTIESESEDEEPSITPLVTVNDFGYCDFPQDVANVIRDYFSGPTTPADARSNTEEHSSFPQPDGSAQGQNQLPSEGSDDQHSDKKEDTNSFFSTPCCPKECCQKFDQELVTLSRYSAQESNYRCSDNINHHHLLLLGQLSSLTFYDQKKRSTGSKKEREKKRTTYMFRGVDVCKKFFLFANNCGERKLRNLKKQLNECGMEAKLHGRQGMQPSNTTDSERIEEFRSFLLNFCDVHALVLPGRLPYHDKEDPDFRILPSSLTKTAIHKEYTASCDSALNYKLFVKFWCTFFPNIEIQKPRTDLCPECFRNTLELGKLHGLSEEDKLQILMKSQKHLERVQTERSVYLNATKRLPSPVNLTRLSPSSMKGSMHYSFDFAQQVFLPYDSQQVGPLYFLAPYKVALSGVACEPVGKCILYLLPESTSSVGKGSNIVISLLHHFLENFGLGEEEVHFHADNCSGQNKNNYLIQYAAWRVSRKLHKKVKVSFLPVGHTKFAPYLYFGCVKRAYRRSSVHSLKDLQDVIVSSCGKNITPFLVANEKGSMYVKVYDWQKYFKSMKATRVPGLLENYHFECSCEIPGQLVYKKSIDSPESLLQLFPVDVMTNDSLPSEIPPHLTSKTVKEKRTNKCGYCHAEGHTNRLSKDNVPLCPKRRQDEQDS